MANQVYLTFYHDGKPLLHPLELKNGDPVSTIQELDHQVLYLGNELFFEQRPIREHKPVRCMLSVEKVTPQLMKYFISGEHFDKVQISWLQYNDKIKRETEYFRHLFEDVKIQHLRIILPDVKATDFARYDHLAELSFRYRRVTWTYIKGNLIVSDEWNKAYEETDEVGEIIDLYAGTEEETLVEPEQQQEKTSEKKVILSNAKFHPEEGKTDFNGKCAVSVDVEYLGETIKKKVLFKLFSTYKDKIQDMQHQIECFESDGTAQGAVTLYHNDDYYSDNTRDSSAIVEYFCKVSHSESEEIESDHLKLPYKKPITCQFVEIPDVLFNHNSAVPMIDADEKLINSIVSALAFAGKNPDKEITIFGHTDSSGETDYNMKLSELRCKSVKAFLENKPQDFVSICKEQSKVEDYQTFLSVLTKKYSWECDPGSIDNQDDTKTKEALLNFQTDYNLFYNKSIDEDGVIGPQTWEAFFNVIMEIITGYAKTETGDKPPALKYAKGNGIHPCGEKYAQDAYAKKGRKSQKDRRVEIVFIDPAEPIEDTPYVDTVVMEPVVVMALPEKKITKIKSITAQCQHGPRIANWGEKLQIVPDAIGDKVTFKIDCDSPESYISWIGPGIEKNSTSYTITHRYSGITSELKNWFANLISGIPPFIPEKTLKILSIDNHSKDKKQVMVEVFPITKKEYDFDLGKYRPKIKKLTDKMNEACTFVGQEIKFKYLEGKITAFGQYKEVSGQKDVFFNFGVEGGFKPLFGANTCIKFPLDSVPWIPSQLKKYVAQIEGTIELEGNLSFTIYIERSEPSKIETGGNLSGEIVVKLGLRASVGNKKLLFVWLKIASGITGEGKVFAEKNVVQKNEKWNVKAVAGAKWNGLKGEISWSILNGTWKKDLSITILEPQKLGEAELPLY